jgi:tRNA/rRNA methyltransferase
VEESLKPVFILIRPQLGENIGAVARVMKNFGLYDLRIVSPRDGWPNKAAQSMAVGAIDIIEQAKIFDCLPEAIEDINTIYASTARKRDLNKQVVCSHDIASELSNGAGKIAILFGPENSGLSNEDLTRSNKIITIPVNQNFSSINIAQAAGIIAYEISQLYEDVSFVPNQASEIATFTELNNFFVYLERELEKNSFFQVPEKKPGMTNNIRSIFTRIDKLSSQEVRTLMGIIKSLTR